MTTASKLHLVVTEQARRRYGLAALLGVITGIIGGHAAWMWVIELTRRDLRNRITHEPDPEVALGAPHR
jgi:uncharacterized membrane protein YagU involved in acid resistance